LIGFLIITGGTVLFLFPFPLGDKMPLIEDIVEEERCGGRDEMSATFSMYGLMKRHGVYL